MTDERQILRALADVLAPAAHGMPAASAVDVAGEGLDRVLAARPDLRQPLARLLAAARGRDPAEVVAQLRADDPAGFNVLTVAVTAAYYMSPRVRSALDYPGQHARPIEAGESFAALDRDLVEMVIRRGPIYRRTP